MNGRHLSKQGTAGQFLGNRDYSFHLTAVLAALDSWQGKMQIWNGFTCYARHANVR